MTTSLIQPSLAGGEIAPALYGRVDLARYLVSLRGCLNWIPQAFGGAINRTGTRFIDEVKDSSKFTRILPFVFSTEQAYVIEAGEEYCRVYRNGARITLSGTPTAWITATLYKVGDHVSIAGVNYYCKIAHTSGTWATDLAAGKWYALTGSIVEFPSEWLEGDLPLLKTTQSADVLTVCHNDYKPTQISRYSHTSWTIGPIAFEFGPMRKANEDTSATVYASGVSGSVTITASSAIFSAADVGRLFYIEQKDKGQAWVAGSTVAVNDIRRANGKYWKDTAGTTCGSDRPDADGDSWNDGGVVWQFLHPGFGVAKITAYTSPTVVSADVVSRIPDASVGAGGATYKWAKGSWNDTDGYPCCSTYHQQRQWFAGSPAEPQTMWASKSDDYTNFGKSSPIVADDTLTYPLVGRQVNAIRNLLALGGALIALTSDANWSITGSDVDGALTQDSVQTKPQNYRGASDVSPLTIGNAALYVQAKGMSVWDMTYDFASNSFTGDCRSAHASHLLEGHTIVSWAHQQVPFGVVWAVRDDGLLLSMTYMREQEVFGWARHDVGGAVEDCCVIPEGLEDALYLVVRRTINGQTKRYIERLENRIITDDLDAFFVDCGLSYDGRNRGTGTITVSGGTAWDNTETLTLTSSSSIFSYPGVGDVGDAVVFVDEAGLRYAFQITGTVSATQALAVPNKPVPVPYRNQARLDWAFARQQFFGLEHLEGKTVAVLVDGNTHNDCVVTGGSITLDGPYSVVHAGLPIVADIETLDIATYGGETVRDKKKNVSRLSLQVERTRGLQVGMDTDHLVPFKQRSTEIYDKPVSATTGLITSSVPGTWSKDGRTFIRQAYPLPAHVLAIIPELSLGGS